MAATFQAENKRAGGGRYLIEHRVHLPYGISGSCDLYDRDTRNVIDWKTTSLPNLHKYQANGPGAQYRTQAHLYALGLQLEGETPEHVTDVFLPRAGLLGGLWVWTEPYNPAVAVKALQRYQAAQDFCLALDPEATPANWALLPTADAYCSYCPWHLPESTDLSQGCPGHSASVSATQPQGV
jgi:hypothetical protein